MLTLDAALDSSESYVLTTTGWLGLDGTPVPDDHSSVTVSVYSELVTETFDDNLLPSWHAVDDAGADINGPSDWVVADKVLYQQSNIYGEGSDGTTRYGARMLMQSSPGFWPRWDNYTVSADIVSGDNDGLGLVFRHHGEGLYFKVDLDSQRSFTRVYRVLQETHTLLAESTALPYSRDVPFHLEVEVHDAEIWVFIDGQSVFTQPVIDETVADSAAAHGIAGLYTWGSGDDGPVAFDNVTVIGLW
jgi:hypothetical protein